MSHNITLQSNYDRLQEQKFANYSEQKKKKKTPTTDRNGKAVFPFHNTALEFNDYL